MDITTENRKWLDDFNLSHPLVIAGPCSAETEDQVMKIAHELKDSKVSVLRAGIWKPRTRPGGFEGVGAIGVGGLSQPLLAAVNACFAASLSLPANMIPESVPVKNVAIGTINSKNFWSIGEMAFKGCVTKINEYNTTNTIPNRVSDKQTPIKNFRRAINCSSVYITFLFSTVDSLGS